MALALHDGGQITAQVIGCQHLVVPVTVPGHDQPQGAIESPAAQATCEAHSSPNRAVLAGLGRFYFPSSGFGRLGKRLLTFDACVAIIGIAVSGGRDGIGRDQKPDETLRDTGAVDGISIDRWFDSPHPGVYNY